MALADGPLDRPPRSPWFHTGLWHRGTLWASSGSELYRKCPGSPWESWDAGFAIGRLVPWADGALAVALPQEGGIQAAFVSGDGSVLHSRLALARPQNLLSVSDGDGFVHIRERVLGGGQPDRLEAMLLPGPDGRVVFQPVSSPNDAHAVNAFIDEEGSIAVLCVEGIYRPAPSAREARWRVRFDETVSEELRAADGLVLHDRWFSGSSLFGHTVVLDLQTLRLRRSALPLRQNEALQLWSAWLSGRRPLARKLLDALWQLPEFAPGPHTSAPGRCLAMRDGADGGLEILTSKGLVTASRASNDGRFDPGHPAAPLLCAWELHLREPAAMTWAMETLLTTNDGSELIPALQARIGRRVGSRLLRYVKGRPTEGLLRGPLAAGKVWFAEGRHLAARTLEAMNGPDPAQALLATRGAPSLWDRRNDGLFAWRSTGWRAALRALVHPDPVVRQEARLLGVRIGPWLELRDEVPDEVWASAGFRDEMRCAVESDDPLGTPLGRRLAWSTWEAATDNPMHGTSLRFAPWDREAACFAGFVQARMESEPGKDAGSALVRSVEALRLEGFHAAFDGMLLALLLRRAAQGSFANPEGPPPLALPGRLLPLLRVLARWEEKDRHRPWKAVIYPDRATRREVAPLRVCEGFCLPGRT